MAFKSDRTLAALRHLTVAQVRYVRARRALTPEAFEALPENALRRTLEKTEFPDMARRRMAFRHEQAGLASAEETEQVLMRAMSQLQGLRLQVPAGQHAGIPSGGDVAPELTGIAVPPPAAGLGVRAWQSLGPGNIGGRTRAVLVHPTQPIVMWLGSAGGGIWQTMDGGGTWFPVDDFMANLAVTTLVMDPTDPQIIYAGTGEGFGNGDALRGAGLFETRDGTAWASIAATAGPDFRLVNRLAISADGRVLMAATPRGVFRSADPQRRTWTRTLSFAVGDLRFHPTDAARAIAGSLDNGLIWQTADGGVTWSEAVRPPLATGRVELCYAAADPNVIYASVNMEQGVVWRSTDGGASFQRRRSLNQDGQPAGFLGEQGWYDNAIWAGDPSDQNFVIVGGIDLWRSTNGGDAFIDISTWWDPRSAHADHHAIVSHPDFDGVQNRTVFFANDGGIFVAQDAKTVGGDAAVPRVTGWTGLNNAYGVTQFFGGAVNPATGTMVCGAQDNGTLAYDPGRGRDDWRPIFGGDGGFCAFDPSDPNIFYGEYVYLEIHRNTDGATSNSPASNQYITGRFWNQVSRQWQLKPLPYRIPDARPRQALFIAPFVLDPNNPATLLAGGESLWRTTNAKAANTATTGPRWARVKGPANGLISAIAIDPNDSDHVWVGHDSGDLWRSDNATAALPAWRKISGEGEQPVDVRRHCHQLAVSPHDSSVVLAAFGEFSRDNIWRSDDRGTSWVNLGAALPEAPVRAVAYHPARPTWIYLGTEVGVFGSEDLGASWSPTNEGPANVSVDDMVWSGTTLYCITHGRGVFTIDIP